MNAVDEANRLADKYNIYGRIPYVTIDPASYEREVLNMLIIRVSHLEGLEEHCRCLEERIKYLEAELNRSGRYGR